LRSVGHGFDSVEAKEHEAGAKRRALIAVDERVVPAKIV
jgi:hypothetical protein